MASVFGTGIDLVINQTGIRSGDVISGAPGKKQSQGVVMEVIGNYPPGKNEVESLSSSDIRDKLNIIPFFEPMNNNERKGWLLQNSVDLKDLYMNDTDIYVKFLKIDGNNFFYEALTAEQIAQLISGNPNREDGSWNIKEVYDMFPGKPGTKPNRRTLVFRPNNWRLLVIRDDIDQFEGIYFDLDNFQLKSDLVRKPLGGILRRIVFESESKTIIPDLGVYSSVGSSSLTLDDVFSVCEKYVDRKSLEEFKEVLNWFPPSVHKSLIQKLIRTRCKDVEFSGTVYPAIIPLLVSFSMLITHPGAFVPNIQRYVTGAESAIKRLAVSICEDSYTEDFNVLLSLYVCALIKQRYKTWNPSKTTVEKWIKTMIDSQGDSRSFDYNWRDFEENITVIDELTASYLVLQEIKSFHSDIKMVGSIAQNLGRASEPIIDIKMEVMPLVHCIDHHSYGDIGHWMPYTQTPYPELFGKIWDRVVGVNPRYPKYADYVNTMEEDAFVQFVRQAQVNLWISKMYEPTNRPYLNNLDNEHQEIEISYEIDSTWIAGLIGPIEVRIKSKIAIVVLRVDNIFEMTAIKKPSRDKNSPLLTEDEQLLAIGSAKKLLSEGIKLKNIPSTLPIQKDSVVYLKDDKYIISSNDNSAISVKDPKTLGKSSSQLIDWDELRKFRFRLRVHPDLGTDESPCNNAVLYTGTGIEENADKKLLRLLEETDLKVLRRLMIYLTGYQSKIKLHRISRDGSGTYYQVTPEDSGVHRFLCAICLLYPAALKMTSDGFMVSNGPLLWSVRDTISEYVKTLQVSDVRWDPLLSISDDRKRWEHQISSVQQMIDRNRAGKKGHLIWIDVGMGKTLIAFDYLEYLIREGQMPKYCVYTLPSSAIDNTVRELQMKGLKYKLMDSRKPAQKTGGNIIEPLTINIIRHDHMILNGMDDKLKEIASECIFIVDEFHKTLAKTKRTSIALELVKLSYDFIGMSGTIIKDTNTDELIEWLEQIVEFEVTKDNYWVAVGALVSRKVQTQVVVERELVEVEMSPDEKEAYNKLVPEKLGGTANSIKFNDALRISYSAATREMVYLTEQYLNLGEGVFLVAKTIQHQEEMRDELIRSGVPPNSISLFGKNNQVTLTPEYNGPIKVVITTMAHNAGYTLTKFRVMIQSEYPSSQATRDQLEGRINRIGQTSEKILVITVVTGILTYMHENHEKARSLSEAIRGFAKDAGIDYKLIDYR